MLDLLFEPDQWPFRHLGGDRRAYIVPLTFGRGRICIGSRHDATGYRDGY